MGQLRFVMHTIYFQSREGQKQYVYGLTSGVGLVSVQKATPPCPLQKGKTSGFMSWETF
jgi:hypothetical protein